MAFSEIAEDDVQPAREPFFQTRSPDILVEESGFKMSRPDLPRHNFTGTRRVPGQVAAPGLSQPNTTESAFKEREPPSAQPVHVEPKTGEPSNEAELLEIVDIDSQDSTSNSGFPSTFETAGQGPIRSNFKNPTPSTPPPAIVPSLVASPTTGFPSRSGTSHGPQSSLEVHSSSIRSSEYEQDGEILPKSIEALEPILEVDEGGASPNATVNFEAMCRMSLNQTAAEVPSASGLPGQSERPPDAPASNPFAETRPPSGAQKKPLSRGPRDINSNGAAKQTHSTSEKDRYRVSKTSSGRQTDIRPRQGQRGRTPAQRPAGSLPKPQELFDLLKFTLCDESAILIETKVTKLENLAKSEREKHRKEMQAMQSRQDGMTSEREDLKNRIEEGRRELREAEKALNDVEKAKKKIEAEAAGKDRTLSTQIESIRKLEKRLGEAQKQANVAGMVEQSCLPLKSGIDEIRSQLELLLNDRQSSQETSEIVRHIQMSAKGLPPYFTKAKQSVDDLAARIDAGIEILKGTRGSTEAISSLKEHFSAEIKTICQELHCQSELQDQCSTLRQENASLAERNARFQERTESVQEQLEASSNNEETLQQTVKELKDEISREKANASISRDERRRLRELEAGSGRLMSELEASRSELQLKHDELEARCKSEKELQARIAALQTKKEASTSGNERLKNEYKQRIQEYQQQARQDMKNEKARLRAAYENNLRGYKQKAERATAELESLSGPNSQLGKLEHGATELRQQIDELKTKNSSLTGKCSAATAELSTLRGQAEGLQNEVQEANEKAVAAEKSRQEAQSELDKTKEALREASSSAQRVEELGEQVRTLTEKEKAVRKELEESDEVAANRHARDEMELEDDWVVAVFEVEQRLEKANDRCHQAEAEAWQHSSECRQLKEENRKLRQQLETAHASGTASSRPQRSIERDESPAVETPRVTKASVPERPRKKVDRSKKSDMSSVQPHPPQFAPSMLSQSQGQSIFSQNSRASKVFVNSIDHILVPGTSPEPQDEDAVFDEFTEQNGTQVVPATFPNSEVASEPDQATGLGPAQPQDRVSSSHSEFQDLYQAPGEDAPLVDRAESVVPATPRGKNAMFREERPRSRANTGRRLSQVASSDSQGTPLARKSQLDSQAFPAINLKKLNVDDRGLPDFTKSPAENILKTFGKLNTSGRGGNSQSPTSAKRPASQGARETESQKRVRQAEIISLDSQTTASQEPNGPGPARTLSQSTHVSETQFPSQPHSQSQSQASSPPHTRMKSSHGRSTPRTGPSQSVKSRKRTSSSQMSERFSQETRR